ncbi:hypothetical protein GO986_12345 [Deinococcus sp. HMF7620]|uniref:Uncharacterized protein n=1 Tax=Deinococcus arboris TaxID=2682977 RepID=A0A7C9LNZ7_9DEIO|nr:MULTISPECIES: hypothetical protein [Deinococcus]MBZ9752189.1 hypothetical protein [Deinococcus betulae]MVN87556.1 hypothetical protein [Deinococcus arboris]
MKKILLGLCLLSSASLAVAIPATPALGNNITSTFNALDLKDRPLMLQIHQGETWQLQMPDAVAKITSGRDDQLDVQVDSNVIFLKAITNSGWGSMTVRLANGDLIQVVYSLASASGRQIRRVVVEYPAPTDTLEADGEISTPAVSTSAATPTPEVTGPQTAPDWLRFGFLNGTRSGNQVTLGYRITNAGTEALVFDPKNVRMQAGSKPMKVNVTGEQNTVIRINAGQTVYGQLTIDTTGSEVGTPVSWSWIGATLNTAQQYEVGGPLTLVLAGTGNDR